MNKTVAASILKLEGEAVDYEEIIKAERQAVFDIKNFIFWNSPIPKLFKAKQKQLQKIEAAVAAFIDKNELEQKDENSGLIAGPDELPDFEDFQAALRVLDLSANHGVSELFSKYERDMTAAKLLISKAQSAKYAAVSLGNLICVEQCFQIVFLHVFKSPALKNLNLIDTSVKLKDSILSSKLNAAVKQLGLGEAGLGEVSAAEVGGSDQDKKTVFTEWYRLAKVYDLPETKK